MDERIRRLWIMGVLFTLFYTTALSGFFAGYMSSVYPHEVGHYFFASMGNRSAIDKIEFYQLRLMRELLSGGAPENLTIRGQVIYKGKVTEVFQGVWIDLVEFGGLAFSLITLGVLIYLLESTKPVQNDMTRAYAFLFILAFFFGAVLDTYSAWWTDGIKLMKYHRIYEGFGRGLIVSTSTLIMASGLYLSYRYLEKFMLFFPSPDRFWQELSLPDFFYKIIGEQKRNKK